MVFSAKQEKDVEQIKDDVTLKKEDKIVNVTEFLDEKRPVYSKETTDAKVYFTDHEQITNAGPLRNRHSETDGRFKIEEISTEAEETTSISSKINKGNANEVSDENNVIHVAAEKNCVENRENTRLEVKLVLFSLNCQFTPSY
jgi:hypothetical protein